MIGVSFQFIPLNLVTQSNKIVTLYTRVRRFSRNNIQNEGRTLTITLRQFIFINIIRPTV